MTLQINVDMLLNAPIESTGFIARRSATGKIRCNFPQVIKEEGMTMDWRHNAGAMLLAKNILSHLDKIGIVDESLNFLIPTPLTDSVADSFVQDFLSETTRPKTIFQIDPWILCDWYFDTLSISNGVTSRLSESVLRRRYQSCIFSMSVL